MTDSLVVLIASPLEPEHVATMRAVGPRIEVWHAPDWLPRVRSVADHHGHPLMRAPEQEARWRAVGASRGLVRRGSFAFE
jgi:hypothetical protein